MAVYKDGKKWMVKHSYRDDEGVKHYTTKRGFETKREALSYQVNFKMEAKSGHTFNDVFNSYIDSHILGPRTQKKYKHAKTLWLDGIAQKRLEKLSDKTFLDIVSKITKSQYSRAYKNFAIRILKALLKHANNYFNTSFKFGLLSSVPKSSDDIKTPSFWTAEEFNQFINHITNPVYHAFFSFLFYTGARLGEARAVYTSDVSSDGRVKLHYQVHQSHLGRVKMKTASSRRTILIHSALLQELQALAYPSGSWLFGGELPLSDSSITRTFKKGIVDSGVKPIRLHDLRHSHASYLISHGANILAVSKRLGHASTSITLSVYAHLLPKIELELIDLIEKGSQKVVK